MHACFLLLSFQFFIDAQQYYISYFDILALVRLDRPERSHNMTKAKPKVINIKLVAAVTRGEAVVYIWPRTVVLINKQGEIVRELCTCDYTEALLVTVGKLTVAYRHSSSVKLISVYSGSLIKIYNIPDHFSFIAIINQFFLLLKHTETEEILMYRLTDKQRNTVRGLKRPNCVRYGYYNNTVYYFVCEIHSNVVFKLNSSWGYINSFGGHNTGDFKLLSPQSAKVSPENTVLICDSGNYRISEYTFEGGFIQHVFYSSYRPNGLSFSYPYLWVVHERNKLYRLKLYKE